MLMRTDPFRELDRLTQQVLGTAARPAPMPMDAYRHGGRFYVCLGLPGIDPGPITRQVCLGETLDADNIAADYAAGVLTLTIPVREAAKPRSIQVTSSDTKQAVTA